ncbi:MAG: hypothetical protein ACKPKO_18735, partial [Candidatus Fonsibacter sp.]
RTISSCWYVRTSRHAFDAVATTVVHSSPSQGLPQYNFGPSHKVRVLLQCFLRDDIVVPTRAWRLNYVVFGASSWM